MTETIYAQASGRGAAGVAIIRVSGNKALDSLKVLTDIENPSPRQAVFCEIKRPVSRETLDKGVVLAFKSPHSYTGESVVEYHVHGGHAVIRGVLEALASCPGHRLAEPGEFTRRAFENGKIDLTEAEGIADLIAAETELQKTQALAQMGGALAQLYEGWRGRLMEILAYVEAEIEFPDEDLPIDVLAKILPQIMRLKDEIAGHLDDNRRGERLRNGIRIAVIGAPNAGKSSFVNTLAQRDVAIVSDMPGTTRDIIEAHLDIGGYPVILFDTAGLRPEQLTAQKGHEAIESEGIRRALACAREADLRLLFYDGTQAMPDAPTFALEDDGQRSIPVINKADQNVALAHPGNPVRLSTKTGAGLDDLLIRMTAHMQSLLGQGTAPALTRQRHREAVSACLRSLERSLSAPLPELAAEDLRLATRDLGRITGRVDVEDLLDIVFRDFCIGK